MDKKASVDEEFLALLSSANQKETNTYDILDIEDDERAHTRMLSWLFTNDGTHGLGTTVLKEFLTAAGLEPIPELREVDVEYFSQAPENAELDILIKTDQSVICIEIKTTGTMDYSQYNRQRTYLEHQQASDDDIERIEHIYLSANPQDRPDYIEYQITWSRVLEIISGQYGAIEQDADLLRLREWVRHLKEHVVDEFQFTPDTRLALEYSEEIERFGISVDESGIYQDRKALFNRIVAWLEQEHSEVFDTASGWNTTRSPSVVRKDTKRLRFAKELWEDENLRYEIHATETRLTNGDNYSGGDSAYRRLDSHVEVTLTYPETNDRTSLVNHLHGTSEERLREAGFVRIAEEFPANADTQQNKYHVYSKQVPVEFDDPECMLKKIKHGIAALIDISTELDDFVEARR